MFLQNTEDGAWLERQQMKKVIYGNKKQHQSKQYKNRWSKQKHGSQTEAYLYKVLNTEFVDKQRKQQCTDYQDVQDQLQQYI